MEALHSPDASVQRLMPLPQTAVTDELNRILALLKDNCPKDTAISFDFDGRLHVHLDIRRQEDVLIVESILPYLGAGLFGTIRRGSVPNHPFQHRVSALLND